MSGYTKSANAQNTVEQWYVVDAKDQILGRLASDIAHVLRGKHMTTYTPHADMKAHVIVLNANKIRLTGDKWVTKKYYHHTMFPGGLRELSAEKINVRRPGDLVRMAVQGMLPKNRLGRATMTHLRIYNGDDHEHKAQKPIPLPVRNAVAAGELKGARQIA